MRIFLNTRSFDKDYQWFEIGADNSFLMSYKNFWEMDEISDFPISDEFSIILGKVSDNNEYFLLITDVDSGRQDNKGREIKNSFLFFSEDEIILRKIIFLTFFESMEFWGTINSIIAETQDSQFGIFVEYSNLVEVINSFANRYDVKFEFDVENHDKRIVKFGEIYLKYKIQNDNEEEIISYRLNPIFEYKLKRFLLNEIFPENFEIIFAYFSFLTLQNIETGRIYLATAKELDRFSKNIFLRDVEEWATFEIENSKFSDIKKKLYSGEKLKRAIGLSLLASLSLFAIYSMYQNNSLTKEVEILQSTNQKMENEISQLTSQIEKLQTEKKKLAEDKTLLADEVASLQEQLSNIDTTSTCEMNISKLQSELESCQKSKEKIVAQRKKLAVGYRWYKNLYNKCKEGK